MKKKMKKMRLFPTTALLLAAVLTGCGSEPTAPDRDLVQSLGADAEPSAVISPDDASDTGNMGDAGRCQ